ncbi:MAG TPA: TadE/TadG family type IV pilus assembly protein [Bradyrhizobium sp.]|jgi:Flp pilus assembly protein TadG
MSTALKSMMRKSRRLRLFARKLLADRRGVAAIEFAMLVPIMLVLFFGTVEFSVGVAANRKVSLMAQTLSDLTSRSISVSDTDISNFFAAGTGIMTPYVAPTYNATSSQISELWIDPSTGHARVQWSKATGTGYVALAVGSTVTLPTTNGGDLVVRDTTGAIVAGQYLIYTQVKFLYQPVVNYKIGGTAPTFTLTDVAYTRPRQAACVIYPTPSSGALPGCPSL